MNNSYSEKNYSESVIFNLSEGNHGAIRVLMDSLINNEKIDPQNAWGALGFILNIAAMNIRGSRIWVLYKMVGCDLVKATAIIRAAQLGIISRAELRRMIDFEDGACADALLCKVREVLEDFAM
jgi:hypothetical protein